jgi:hypothetical protein
VKKRRFVRATYAREMLAKYEALDTVLVAKGFPSTSPWWLKQVRRYFESDCRQVVFRVGRRGGKSSTLCRIAVLEALFGAHVVPPGDVGVVAFISVSRDEASQRLRTVRAILDALAVKYRPIDGGLELTGERVVFKVYTTSVAGVSGPTFICVIGDEVSKWRDLETGANPAREVLASVRPGMATQPRAKIVLSSSPLGRDDAHAAAFDQGDTAFQFVAFAETWVANPTLSEADTHELEPDVRLWSREYAAQPQAGALAAFDTDAVQRAFGRWSLDIEYAGTPILVIDASSGRKDAWTWGIARWVRPRGTHASMLRFELVDGLGGQFWQQVSGSQVVERIAGLAKTWGIHEVHGDQRESLMLQSEFARHGVRFIEHAWTAVSKPVGVAQLRRWFADGDIALPAHDRLHRELLAFEERINPSGAFTFAARGSGHDDYVALLITCAMAVLDRHLVPITHEASTQPRAIRTRFSVTGGGFESSGFDFISPPRLEPAPRAPQATQEITVPMGPNARPQVISLPPPPSVTGFGGAGRGWGGGGGWGPGGLF